MNKFFFWLLNPPTDGPKSTLLLRLMAGGVFFWEGILKFVYVNQGVGRFTKLGIPFPHFTAAFIGYLEIVGGMLPTDRPADAADRDPVCRRDDRSDPFDQDFAVSGHVAPAFAAGASAGRVLGGIARNTVRLRADSHCHFSVNQWAGKVVAGCGAPA